MSAEAASFNRGIPVVTTTFSVFPVRPLRQITMGDSTGQQAQSCIIGMYGNLDAVCKSFYPEKVD
jgi:hypothetical protein